MDDWTIDDVEVKLDWNGSSEAYSNGDLQAAVNKIANYLDVKVEFQQISYQWDKESANQLSYCKELNPEVDECVFFKTNFYVPEYKNFKDETTNTWKKYKTYKCVDTFPVGHGEKSVFLIELQNY